MYYCSRSYSYFGPFFLWALKSAIICDKYFHFVISEVKFFKLKKKEMRHYQNDNTVLFSSLLLDACIVPVSIPVCHYDSRQLQQQPLMNEQQQQYQQNNLAYQQANQHSYTSVSTSNQTQGGPGLMGANTNQPASGVAPHLQAQVSKYVSSFALYCKLFFKLLLSCLHMYFSSN